MPALLINDEIYGDTPSKKQWELLGTISGIDNSLTLPESFEELYVEARATVEVSSNQTTLSLCMPKIVLNDLGKDFVIGAQGSSDAQKYLAMFRVTNTNVSLHSLSVGSTTYTDTATMIVYYK